jgi:hypothetical protein
MIISIHIASVFSLAPLMYHAIHGLVQIHAVKVVYLGTCLRWPSNNCLLPLERDLVFAAVLFWVFAHEIGYCSGTLALHSVGAMSMWSCRISCLRTNHSNGSVGTKYQLMPRKMVITLATDPPRSTSESPTEPSTSLRH